ncbi:PH domain-containing protein [Pedobacter mucosus]|uniref:PH domain-containing protein n=1 Tax=Pedobacter mucosus TaxID=2895286 RepID=UPI001EE44693|nr:PH domain-containing protein [Pedobacter mucosus]UKT62306.1 PH domain-containing protein [Pedobacter mucosus]
MNSDFSKPQRQSAAGIIIMGVYTTFKIGKAFIFLIVIAFVKLPSAYFLYLVLGIGGIIFFSFLFAYLWYLKFTFFLDKEKQEFVINKGILNRDQLIIQLDKIQQVNINQSILQKIIGVYGIKIDTAGAHGEEVSIQAIDEISAYNLKEHLLSNRNLFVESIQTDQEQTINEEVPFLKISAFTLLKVGLTSNYGRSLALLAAFFYTVIYEGRQLLDAFKIDKDEIQNTVSSMVTLVTVAILVVILLIVLLVVNLARTFYKYYDLEISQHQHSLLISSGLIAKKATLISPNKVQVSSYSQNYFQKKINMFNLSLKQAHFGHHKKGDEIQGNTLEIPGCNSAERDELLKMILVKLPKNGQTFIPDWRFLNLPIFFKLILPVAIFFIVAINIPEVKPFISAAILYLVLGIFLIYISYRRHRIIVNQDFIIKKSGIWDISNEIIIPSKIQAITTFQYPWHKSVDVGHVSLHTAAGQIHFKYGNYTEIKRLVNYWLYQLESENKDWM